MNWTVRCQYDDYPDTVSRFTATLCEAIDWMKNHFIKIRGTQTIIISNGDNTYYWDGETLDFS